MAFKTVSERLQWARERAGYDNPTDAARAMGVPEPTYLGHENGSRGLSRSAPRYSQFFKVSLDWLVNGKGNPNGGVGAQDQATVPLVGYVGAGAAMNRFNVASGELDRVPAPEDATPNTVAVEIRGDSLGSFFDRWLVYYDDVRRPVTSDLLNTLCVVSVADDGGVFIKKIKPSRTRGLFHLYGQFGDPILDVHLEWAARVKNLVPR